MAPARLSPRIAALVLAAGQSTRMRGKNKLLFTMPGGKSMIAQTVDHALASTAHPVIVVTGHQAQNIKAALTNKQVQFVHEADYAKGMSHSVRAGIRALTAEIDAVLICLGDMPLVEPAMLRHIMSLYAPARGHEIIIPTFEGQRGNPVLWGKRFFFQLQNLSGDRGGGQIMHHYSDVLLECQVSTDGVRRDFDTFEKLAALF